MPLQINVTILLPDEAKPDRKPDIEAHLRDNVDILALGLLGLLAEAVERKATKVVVWCEEAEQELWFD